MERIEEHIERMNALAKTLEETIKTFGNRGDIHIEYQNVNDTNILLFTNWQIKIHHIYCGMEYFLIYENIPGEGFNLLYAVNISCDSYLTAASELMDLASRKCL